MKKALSAFVSGALFSIGLTISGMTNPANVRGFLDVAGDWNPSLFFVLLAAVVVTGVGYRLVWKRPKPLFEPIFSVPTSRIIDARLLIGAAIFGIGWGLIGLCPGPALSSVVSGESAIFVFIAAMLAGMLLQRSVLSFITARTQGVASK